MQMAVAELPEDEHVSGDFGDFVSHGQEAVGHHEPSCLFVHTLHKRVLPAAVSSRDDHVIFRVVERKRKLPFELRNKSVLALFALHLLKQLADERRVVHILATSPQMLV